MFHWPREITQVSIHVRRSDWMKREIMQKAGNGRPWRPIPEKEQLYVNADRLVEDSDPRQPTQPDSTFHKLPEALYF
jgi:hypothetical protein